MKKSVEVSVIMSDYNADEKNLKEAIQSILNQTFTNFEYIIVDDCSKNNLNKIIANFNDIRIRIIKNSSNIGLALSLNKAIAEAKGKYIVRMDSDDISMPDRIEKLYEHITLHPEYDVIGSRAIEFSGDKYQGILGKPGEKSKKSIMRGDSLIHPSVIIKKESLIEVGGYDNYLRAQDLALWCKMLLKGKRLYVINDVLLKYRVNFEDYKKRSLINRRHEIKIRFNYYPKMQANLLDYLSLVKSIVAGILPIWLVRSYRHNFSLKKLDSIKTTDSKILLLLDKDNDMFAQLSKRKNIEVMRVYKDISFIAKIIRRLHLISNLPYYHLWYSDWKKKLEKFDTIITHASIVKVPVVKYINRHDNTIRVIFWYWNSVKLSLNPNLVPGTYCEKWSFDIADCKQHKMKYNTQFYYDEISIQESIIKNDILFVGADKGRYKTVTNLESEFSALGLKCDFFIMPSIRTNLPLGKKYSKPISYSELLDKISGSKAILDIVSKDQSGLTLRPMESIFLKKKLITNLHSIKKYDFYNKNNIFILGEDNISNLKSFIDSPYIDIPTDIVQQYDFDNWVERFVG